jgi:hypothetical protein
MLSVIIKIDFSSLFSNAIAVSIYVGGVEASPSCKLFPKRIQRKFMGPKFRYDISGLISMYKRIIDTYFKKLLKYVVLRTN